MKKKFLLSLFFLLIFFIILSFKSNVFGFSYSYNGKEYDFGESSLENATNIVVFLTGDTPSGTPKNIFCMISDSKISINNVNGGLGFSCVGNGNLKYIYIPSGKVMYDYVDEHFSISGSFLLQVLYSNYDIYNEDGTLYFENSDAIRLDLTVTPSEETKNVPVVISTNFYSLEIFEDILVQYNYTSSGAAGEDWTTCSWGRVTDSSSPNDGKYNFYVEAYRNGSYHFRLVNLKTMEYIYKDIIINNILYSPDDVNNYVDGVFDPTPFLSYEYINDDKINIITQKFFIDQIIDLQCFYAKDISKEDYNNNEKWTKVEARTMVDQLTQRDVYQFCFEVDNNNFNADGTYTVRFYNVFLDKYTYSEIVINFDEILNVDGSMIWRYVHFFKERFGFLIYPFDLTINTLKRIAAINYGEPKFNIPDIYEPTTNKKLISSVTFNFNDYLENNTFKTVHNIYLVIVDAAIVFGLLNLAWKKISGVFK